MDIKREEGQSIIILAFAVVVLLAFVGMAIDVGLLYGRRIQLQRAVDAAALAAAVELPDEAAAQGRAAQFVRLNGFDPGEANVAVVAGYLPGIGTSNFLTVTAQLPMETMFMRFVGWPTVQVPALAVAEYKSPMEIYASQHPESGKTGAVNLSVFGKDSNPQWGDAFMATQWTGEGGCGGVTPSPNPYWGELNGAYPFRIHVPANYEARNGTSELQVEILDPDCWNNPNNSWYVKHIGGGGETKSVSPTQQHQSQVAAIETGDPCRLAGGIPCNEFWQVRMDQHLAFCPGLGAMPMTTRYTLYYYKQNDLTKYQIAQYEKGLNSDTDLKWVAPNGFRFNLNDYSDVMTDEDGSRSFFIDVAGLAGTYGNGFDLWAGPPPTVTVPTDVNARNVFLMQNKVYSGTNPHDSGGVVIWAIGYLPLNVNATTAFTVTLGYIPASAAGTRIRISSWDMDRDDRGEAGRPCRCRPEEVPGHNCLGLSLRYYLEGAPWPGKTMGEPVVGTVSCSTQWANDVFRIPEEFYGGYLYAVYHTNAQDTTDWRLEYLDVVDNTYVRLVR